MARPKGSTGTPNPRKRWKLKNDIIIRGKKHNVDEYIDEHYFPAFYMMIDRLDSGVSNPGEGAYLDDNEDRA